MPKGYEAIRTLQRLARTAHSVFRQASSRPQESTMEEVDTHSYDITPIDQIKFGARTPQTDCSRSSSPSSSLQIQGRVHVLRVPRSASLYSNSQEKSQVNDLVLLLLRRALGNSH